MSHCNAGLGDFPLALPSHPREIMDIQVTLEVSRWHSFADGSLQVWGHVGDYEVCVWLPANHKDAKRLLDLGQKEGDDD